MSHAFAPLKGYLPFLIDPTYYDELGFFLLKIPTIVVKMLKKSTRGMKFIQVKINSELRGLKRRLKDELYDQLHMKFNSEHY